jgi:Holliday junction resolvase
VDGEVTNYQSGRANEYRIRDDLVGFGYECVRAAGSKGKADIVALRPGEVLLVQVKASNPQIAPAERVALVEMATAAGALPLVAHKPSRKPVVYRRLTGVGPKDWIPWLPIRNPPARIALTNRTL